MISSFVTRCPLSAYAGKAQNIEHAIAERYTTCRKVSKRFPRGFFG